MLYEGKIYSGGKFLGTIYSKSLTRLKMVASQRCNNYFSVIDELEVRCMASGCEFMYRRINKKCPNNTIARGRWM